MEDLRERPVRPGQVRHRRATRAEASAASHSLVPSTDLSQAWRPVCSIGAHAALGEWARARRAERAAKNASDERSHRARASDARPNPMRLGSSRWPWRSPSQGARPAAFKKPRGQRFSRAAPHARAMPRPMRRAGARASTERSGSSAPVCHPRPATLSAVRAHASGPMGAHSSHAVQARRWISPAVTATRRGSTPDANPANAADACGPDATLFLDHGRRICGTGDAGCPRGARRSGGVCGRSEHAVPRRVASGPAIAGCRPIVVRGPSKRRVDVGGWAALAIGTDGGFGSPDLCRPLEQEAQVFDAAGSSGGPPIRVRIALQFPDQDLSRESARIDAWDAQGQALHRDASRVVERAVTTMAELLRSLGRSNCSASVDVATSAAAIRSSLVPPPAPVEVSRKSWIIPRMQAAKATRALRRDDRFERIPAATFALRLD